MRRSMVSCVHLRDLIATFSLQNCDDLSERIMCAQRKFRTIDGTCNNLCNITKAAIFTPLIRTPGLSPPTAYATPDFLPRNTSVNGGKLPNPRLVRQKVLPSDDANDLGGTPSFTHVTMTWGQFIDHDIALTEQVEAQCGTNQETCPDRPEECIGIDIRNQNLRLRFNPEFKCIPLRRSSQDKNGEQVGKLILCKTARKLTTTTIKEIQCRKHLLVSAFRVSPAEFDLPSSEKTEYFQWSIKAAVADS